MLDPFDEVSVVINDVHDLTDARNRAEDLRSSGVLGRVVVADALPAALRATGLRMRHLRPLEHYTDNFLVKFTTSECDYVCYWDTDVGGLIL